jgi:predicted transcriptional regulator
MQANRAFLQAKGNRRDKFVIISAMLSYAVEGVGKTELMYKVGLSSAQLERYLPILVRSELLEVSTGKKKPLYRTTDKGKSFLDTFDTLVKLLD